MDTPHANVNTDNPHPQPTISIDKGVGDEIVTNNNNISIQNGDRKRRLSSQLRPPPYSERTGIINEHEQSEDTVPNTLPQRKVSRGRVSFDLGSNRGYPLEPNADRKRKVSREMSVQTDRTPRVSFCLEEHPFFPERTPSASGGNQTTASSSSSNQSTATDTNVYGIGARPKTPSPRVSFSSVPKEIGLPKLEDALSRSEYESSLSKEPPKRVNRQRRSGVIDTSHMCMPPGGLVEGVHYPIQTNSNASQSTNNSNISDHSSTTTCEERKRSFSHDSQIGAEEKARRASYDSQKGPEERLRKISYDSQVELGQINKGFDPSGLGEDTHLEIIQRKVENVVYGEMKENGQVVGRWTIGDTDDEESSRPSTPAITSEAESSRPSTPVIISEAVSTESIPMSTQTDNVPLTPTKARNGGTKSILKKTSRSSLEPISIDASDIPVIEKKNKHDKKDTIAMHVRKDSIALTSEKMGQIQEIRRKYSGVSQPVCTKLIIIMIYRIYIALFSNMFKSDVQTIINIKYRIRKQYTMN